MSMFNNRGKLASRTQFIRVVVPPILVALCFGIAGDAGGTQLLAEITFNQPPDANGGDPPPTIPALFSVQENLSSRVGAVFRYEMEPANLGTTITVPSEMVSDFDDFLKLPTAYFYTDIGFSSFNGEGYLDDLLTNGWTRGPIVRHVPRLGPGLVGYDVTEITVTVDSLTLFKAPNNPDLYVHGGQHTIRIYGNALPEPAAAALAAVAALVEGRRMRRR